MRNQKLQCWKVLEQIGSETLHEGRCISVQIVRARGVEAAVAAGTDVNHGRDVVLNHFFVNGVPLFVAQGG